jgi:hypothetical protein
VKHLYRYPLLLLAAWAAFTLFFQGVSNSGGPPGGYTGAPGELGL